MITKDEIVKLLNLEAHPKEGGLFRRTYESSIECVADGVSRKILTSIYYLLTDDNSIGFFHKNKSDIIHYHHSGGPIIYYLIHPDGQLEQITLGANLREGQVPQLVVKGGVWKASRLKNGEFGLISEAVAPGFVYDDNILATSDLLESIGITISPEIAELIK